MKFEFLPPSDAAPRRVDLLGEVSDWLNPIPMVRGKLGTFVAEAPLPVGVYAYKFLVDGAWTLDPGNPRTRSTGGRRNSVVSVGGMDEPLLFAPTSPFVVAEPRGGLRVMVAVRKGGGAAPVVRWAEHEGGPPESLPLVQVAEEDEHLLYAARLPTSAARVRYEVGLDATPRTVRFTHDRTSEPRLPGWWRDAVLYTVYVDRFRPAVDRAGWEESPGRNTLAGGDLEGLRRSLDELLLLGVTVLYLTPVHVAQSSHRYDFIDPLAIDPGLGGEEAFARLVADAHALGLRLLMDVSFSHAGVDFPPCADVLARGRSSPYAGWFLWDERGGAPVLRHYGRRTDAPLLNLEHEEVQALVLRAVEAWARRGVDGLRLDMAAEVPRPLARAIRARFRALAPDGVVLGELIPSHAWRWLAGGAVDVATDFDFHGLVTAMIAQGTLGPREAFARLAASELRRGGADVTRVRFLSTHDHPRFATLAHAYGRDAYAPLGLVLLTTMPGVPALLYGEEVGLRSATVTGDPEDVWEDRAPMPWAPAARDERTRRLVVELLAARRGSAALARGELELLHADERLLVYRRIAEGEVVDVVMNLGAEEAALELADAERPAFELLARVGSASVSGQTVTLGGASALVARRVADAVARRARSRLTLLARDRDLAQGRSATSALPSRIDLAVTEACNLRCAHCITSAPSRTTSGEARTMTPWVLDRLRPSFACSSYFGFVHGGESLTAPIFWDVLRAIREERGDEPYVAHLLTNGTRLEPAVLERLLDAGVSSISVSLDGASAATNDAIRVGGRFEKVLENVRHAVRIRRERGCDLRVGISSVVLATNAVELPALVELAASLGVDWLKLEEGVPVNAFAERSLVGLSPKRLRSLVAASVTRAAEHGLVLVDHTVERTIWRCRLDAEPEAQAFVRADEYANRSEIHPCRAPWEVACVEPNGDVRGGDFFGPVLGNVTREELGALWNGPRAQEERARSRRERVCGEGPVTCVTVR